MTTPDTASSPALPGGEGRPNSALSASRETIPGADGSPATSRRETPQPALGVSSAEQPATASSGEQVGASALFKSELEVELHFAAITLYSAVEGDDANGELADWFRPGYLREVAKLIGHALQQLSSLVASRDTRDAGAPPRVQPNITVWFVERLDAGRPSPEWLRHGSLARHTDPEWSVRDDEAWTNDPRRAAVFETEHEAHVVISRYVAGRAGIYARPTEHSFIAPLVAAPPGRAGTDGADQETR